METTLTRTEWIRRKGAILNGQQMTRERYESLCVEWAVTCHDDGMIDAAFEAGDYWGIPYDAIEDSQIAYLGPGYTAESCRRLGIESLLRQQRWFAIRSQAVALVDCYFGDSTTDGKCINEKNLSAWLWFSCPAAMRAQVATAIRSDPRWRGRDEVLKRIEERNRKSPKCKICGDVADMVASLGPACSLHYDDLSG